MSKIVYKEDLIEPELSYKIVGCAYDAFNEIGGGHKEKVYQKALRIKLESSGLKFCEQVHYPIIMDGKVLDKAFFDFLVEDKIIVEIKALSSFTRGHYTQVLDYLNRSGKQLALLITFGQNEVGVKRVVNFSSMKSAKPN